MFGRELFQYPRAVDDSRLNGRRQHRERRRRRAGGDRPHANARWLLLEPLEPRLLLSSVPLLDGPLANSSGFAAPVAIHVSSAATDGMDAATPLDALAPAAPVVVPGDLNNDGRFDASDVAPFELALADPAAFADRFPGVDPLVAGDVNGDGAFNAFDVAPVIEGGS